MDRDEERRIIAQVCAGDTNAFEALVVAYQKQVYNLALRTVGNEEDAADMTQEVFLRACSARGGGSAISCSPTGTFPTDTRQSRRREVQTDERL